MPEAAFLRLHSYLEGISSQVLFSRGGRVRCFFDDGQREKLWRCGGTRKTCFYIGFRNDLHIDFVFPKGSTEDDEKKLTLWNIIWDLQETAVPAGPKNYHNPEAINNNEYFTGAYSPIFMCPQSMSRPTRQRSFLQSTSSARRPGQGYYT